MKKNKKKRLADESRQAAAPAVAGQEKSDSASLWHNPLLHLLLILCAGIAVYADTISFPFYFDDLPYLQINPAIRSFNFLTDPDSVLQLGIYSDVKNNVLLRPVAYATFAFNYALHGLDVRGYHLFNMLLHFGNSLLVYLFVRLVLSTPVMSGREAADDDPAKKYRLLPLFCALLFAVHPLQTQAVTYIIQRFVPLCTFFALSSLLLYGYARQTTRYRVRVASYLLSLATCVLAMLSKEIAFTVPVMIVLYEVAFLDGAPGRRVVRLVPFLLSMAIIPAMLMKLATFSDTDNSEAVSDAINLVNFRGTSSWDYLMSQFGVMVRYLRLLILPVNQNFDYDYKLQTQFFTPAVLLPLLLLLVIAGTGIWLLVRSRKSRCQDAGLCALTAFGIFWFFLTQAVVSSIIPIDDLIFEHRAYFPSIGFFLATLSGAALLYNVRRPGKSLYTSPIAIGILSAAILVYATAGFKRNSIWEEKTTFWRDVVSKSPNKARPHARLGLALLEEPHRNQDIAKQLKSLLGTGLPGLDSLGDSMPFSFQLSPADQKAVEEAMGEFRAAVRIRPKWWMPHLNLADALLLMGESREAKKELETARDIMPGSYIPRISLGLFYESEGDFVKAGREYREAIRLAPNSYSPHIAMAELSAKTGDYAEASREYEIAWQLFPDDEVRFKLEDMRKKSRHAG